MSGATRASEGLRVDEEGFSAPSDVLVPLPASAFEKTGSSSLHSSGPGQ